MGNIFVVAACTAGKGSKVASFVGKIFVVRPLTTNILPHENYPLYGSLQSTLLIYMWLISLLNQHACIGRIRN